MRLCPIIDNVESKHGNGQEQHGDAGAEHKSVVQYMGMKMIME